MRMNCFSHEFHGVRILVKIEIESPIWIEIRSMSKREKPKDRILFASTTIERKGVLHTFRLLG